MGTIVDVAGRVEGSEVMLREEGSRTGRSDGAVGLSSPIGTTRLTGLQMLKLDPLMTSVMLKGKQVASLRATGT